MKINRSVADGLVNGMRSTLFVIHDIAEEIRWQRQWPADSGEFAKFMEAWNKLLSATDDFGTAFRLLLKAHNAAELERRKSTENKG